MDKVDVALTFGQSLSSYSNIVIAVANVLLVLVAYIQLRNLVKNNFLKTILDLEKDFNERKVYVDLIISKIRIEGIRDTNSELIPIYSDDLEAAKESYFNILDRLCFCLLKKYLPEKEVKSEYCNMIKDTVYLNKSSFGIGTSYKNVKKILEKWDI